MNGYDAKRQREEILKKVKNEQQMAQYRQNQQRANISPLSIINKANGLSKGLFNTGSRLQKAGNFLQTGSNPMWNKFGSKMGEVGSKMQNLSLRPQIGGMLTGGAAPAATTASTMTGAGGSAIGNAIGTGTAALPSTIGATGTGIGAGAGALGGAGTAAGGSALTGAISSAAPAATSLASGTGAAGLGAAGIAGAASAALPIAGAAILAGQLIKGQLEKAQQKANAKAMQADANAINATENRVNQQKQGVMNDLMQQSQQDAQAMTLPTQQDIQMPSSQLSQEIMKQAYPDYTNTAPNLNDNSSLGINTPETIETFQNESPSIPQDNSSAISDMINNYVTDAPQTGNVLTDAINTAQVNPAVEDTKTSIMDKVRGALGDFKTGYDDNSQHGFAEGDLANRLAGTNTEEGEATGWAAPVKKSIMNRLGEAVGTGRRLMANPWVQAGIAGGISKAAGGDIDDIAKAAYDYGTAKAKSDQYYKAINPDAKVMPVFNTFDANDYKAKAYNDFNQGRSMISRRDLFKLNNPNMSDEEVDRILQQTGINGDEMISLKGYDSVQKANYNNVKLNQGQQKIDNQKEYQQGQLQVSQGRAAETERHNRVSEGQRSRSIANTKANNDRNYSFKVEQAKKKAAAKQKTSTTNVVQPANTHTLADKPKPKAKSKSKAKSKPVNQSGKNVFTKNYTIDKKGNGAF